jgi:hypothetical protein
MILISGSDQTSSRLQIFSLSSPKAVQTTGTVAMRAGSRVPNLVAGSIIREPISHRLFGRKRLRVCSAKVVATLGPGRSVILHGLMMGIDQGVIADREKTFGETIDGVLLRGGEHFAGSFTVCPV